MRRTVLTLAFGFSASPSAVAQDSSELTRSSAREIGLAMWPLALVVLGNRPADTSNVLHQPTLALDTPVRALVWKDLAGKVSVSWNSTHQMFGTIYSHPGLTLGEGAAVGPGYIRFDADGEGEFAFGAVQGGLDCHLGGQSIHFTWKGSDDMGHACCDGNAQLEEGGILTGEIRFHRVDGSSVTAQRW